MGRIWVFYDYKSKQLLVWESNHFANEMEIVNAQ